MSAPIAITIGPDEALRVVLKELERFAAPRKLPATSREAENLRRYKNVEVWFDMNTAGLASFHFITHDNIEMSIQINFLDLDREYLDSMNHDIQKELNNHRANRKGLRVIEGGKVDIKLNGDSLSQSPPGGSNGNEKESSKEKVDEKENSQEEGEQEKEHTQNKTSDRN